MQKHLFFICPTDALEGLINRAYKEENYFLSSLANSINFSEAVSETINALIETKCITEISFVLSTNNALFLDALSPQNFNSIKVLHPLYKAVNAQKKNCPQILEKRAYSDSNNVLLLEFKNRRTAK